MAARTTITIPPDIKAILNAATIDKDTLTLTGTLDRKTYQQTAKIIEALGGKWDRKKACHVFPCDVKTLLSDDTTEVVHQKNARQAFYTPHPLADSMCQHANISTYPKPRILEPSCGNGALLRPIGSYSHNAIIVAIEMDKETALQTKLDYPHAQVICQDFLVYEDDKLFDVILMNPPFSKGQDIAHVMKAIPFLAQNGTLVAIMSPSAQNGTTKKHSLFHKTLASFKTEWHEIPANTFKESGTSIATSMLVLTKV